MLNHISSALRGRSRSRSRGSSVDVQASDVDEGQVGGLVSEGALPRELQNLGGDGHIVVNHTYNIHYQSEHSSLQHLQDAATMAQEYGQATNSRSRDICKVATHLCVDLPREPEFVTSPELKVVTYFSESSGIPSGNDYIPDAKYRRNHVRKLDGKEIQLHQLHESIGSGGTKKCRHVALVGTQGCGKSVMCKRYVTKVLQHEVPELADVELVHYITPKDLPLRKERRRCSIGQILFERIIHTNISFKYGYEWMCKNPEKILFVFDGVDRTLLSFSEHVEPINYHAETYFDVLLQNILTNHFLPGCRTLISARDRAFKDVLGNCRPEKFVVVGCLNVDQRLSLIRSICTSEVVAEDFCNRLLRRFPAGLYYTKYAVYLNLAVAALTWGSQGNNPRIETDVLLVIMMLQHVLRSYNSSKKLVYKIGPFRVVAFEMIRDGVISRRLHELVKYADVNHHTMADLLVTAPQHKHRINYRLLPNDHSYFFANQVLQEVLAACYIAEMLMPEFSAFVDEQLHTERWLVVRRFVCGIVLHEGVAKNLGFLRSKISHGSKMEQKLLSSLAEQLEKMDSLSSYERLELISSLYECGKAAQSIIGSGVRSLVLPGIALEPCDLYAISRIEQYVMRLHEVDICIGGDVNIEEFDQIASFIITKGDNVHLDLSNLRLTSSLISGLERSLKVIGGSKCHTMRITASKQTSSDMIRLLENISKGGPCSISVELVEVTDAMDES